MIDISERLKSGKPGMTLSWRTKDLPHKKDGGQQWQELWENEVKETDPKLLGESQAMIEEVVDAAIAVEEEQPDYC